MQRRSAWCAPSFSNAGSGVCEPKGWWNLIGSRARSRHKWGFAHGKRPRPEVARLCVMALGLNSLQAGVIWPREARKHVMSAQFGRWNFKGETAGPAYIEKVNATLAPYGPDSDESYSKDGLKILYRSFCTTKESWGAKQPHVCPSGAVLTWDGRLDNRAEIVRELGDVAIANATDVEIVAAAFERWGNDCFPKFIGDWTLSICNPISQSLLLAKDVIGTKHLYYSFERNEVTWSTILDPIVLFSGKPFSICEEYAAGWFSDFPAASLTPYVGIRAVPASSFVTLRPGKHSPRHTITEYWDFDPGKRVRYAD